MFRTIEEVEEFIDALSRGEMCADLGDHCVRLVVGLWFLSHFDEAEATNRVIHTMHRAFGGEGSAKSIRTGYHETETLFWLAMIRQFYARNNAEPLTATMFNDLLARYGNHRHLIRKYYSRQRLGSWQARTSWIEPDLMPLNIGESAV